MKRSSAIVLFICGCLMLAAFPVLAQDNSGKELTINRKPLHDLGDLLISKTENGTVDLSRPFKVVLEGKITKKVFKTGGDEDLELVGFDENESRWITLTDEEAGDAEVGKIAREAIQAVGDSGFLAYFYNLGIRQIRITFGQDNEKVIFVFESELPSEERARTITAGLHGLLAVAAVTFKDGTDERVLLDNARKTPPISKGKNVIIHFELPKDVAREMIGRQLTLYKNREELREQK